ncbi:MAG: enamine deaminase RidA, partial [Rhodobacteraceae bacterium]
MASKQIIGGPLIINGRTLSLSKAIRAGDFIFLTGQVPIKNGEIVVEGSIEEQTVIVIEEIKNTLKLAGAE